MRAALLGQLVSKTKASLKLDGKDRSKDNIMTLEAEFSSALPQILPGYLNKLLKVRSKMGYRQIQRGGSRTGIWKKFTGKQFTFLVIRLGEAPKQQSVKDTTSQVLFLHLLKGIKTHLPPHRCI